MRDREPVLILSYYFPPCNLTPAERVLSFAKFLPKGNYYPIVITRNWDIPVTNSTTDAFLSSGDTVKIVQHENYEVHYLPYHGNTKDRVFRKVDGTPWYFLYHITAFITILFNLFFIKQSVYGSFYRYITELRKKKPGIQKMLVSASPYELFGVAYALHRKQPIDWIADYRDDWSTSEVYHHSFFKKIVNLFNRYFEKKWLATSLNFVSVSAHYVEKIADLVHKKGRVLTNGFMPENYRQSFELYPAFTITHVGAIYPTQPIEHFLSGMKKFIQSCPAPCRVNVIFVGIANEPAVRQRIEEAIKGYESYFQFTARVPKATAIEIQSRSHLLLLCSHQHLKGVPGSKLYEYIALKKKVLVFPSDGDIVEDTLTRTGQGLICHKEEDLIETIRAYYNAFEQDKLESLGVMNNDAMLLYSREKQAEVLCELFSETNDEQK